MLPIQFILGTLWLSNITVCAPPATDPPPDRLTPTLVNDPEFEVVLNHEITRDALRPHFEREGKGEEEDEALLRDAFELACLHIYVTMDDETRESMIAMTKKAREAEAGKMWSSKLDEPHETVLEGGSEMPKKMVTPKALFRPEIRKLSSIFSDTEQFKTLYIAHVELRKALHPRLLNFFTEKFKTEALFIYNVRGLDLVQLNSEKVNGITSIHFVSTILDVFPILDNFAKLKEIHLSSNFLRTLSGQGRRPYCLLQVELVRITNNTIDGIDQFFHGLFSDRVVFEFRNTDLAIVQTVGRSELQTQILRREGFKFPPIERRTGLRPDPANFARQLN